MSVILTDMNMPKCCLGCEFSKRWDNASCRCDRKPYESPISYGEGRPSFCPLQELVRCKDCEYGYVDETGNDDNACIFYDPDHPNWFCADGKPKAIKNEV